MKATVWLVFVLTSVQSVPPYNNRTTADRIESFGYSAETHSVTTLDGYILNIFRIRSSEHPIVADYSRPVVLLVHGLISSSDSWVINGPDNALATNLVDSGYDVWLGNCRGNPYADRHLTLSPKQKSFWHFSIHELGTIDLPSMIDYILQQTRQQRLHYVGHSQGTTMLLMLLSTHPQYNAKIMTGHLMAPVAFMKRATSRIIRFLSPLFLKYTLLNSLIGNRPLLQGRLIQTALGIEYCRQPLADREQCSQLLYALSGGVSAYFNASLLPEILATHPASCSTHQLIHLVQLYNSGSFRPYDYGPQGNLLRYGQTSPPNYKLTRINTQFPLHLYYSDFDELSSKTDVERLSKLMGNRTVSHFIDRRYFAHIDFIWSSIVRQEINQVILNIMYDAEIS